jgi:pimeloyl-ACP methyl ester carboxylesterase
MATFVLIPGAGSGPDHWRLVAPLLEAAGHDVVTPDLPNEDDAAGLPEYTAAAIGAIGEREDLIVVGQSLGAFTAAAVAAERPTRMLVYLNGMIPAPGESAGEWWGNTGYEAAAAELYREHGPMSSWADEDFVAVFLHDVPPAVIAATAQRNQGGGIMATPLTAWPDGVPVRAISGSEDRFFPLSFQQRVVRERLGIAPDLIPTGHVSALALPDALAELLNSYAEG